MRLTVAIMVQFPDSSSIMLCHQDLPRGRDILWEIKSVSWHKKVALGSLPGLLRSYAPKYRRTMHMAWVLSAHCPALSLWATFCFFVCRRWASGACSRAAGADLGPCSVLQRAAAGFHTALCYVTCPLSPACMELGHRSQLSTHCYYGNTWCYDMGGDNILQMWGLLDREDTKTLFINIKQRK